MAELITVFGSRHDSRHHRYWCHQTGKPKRKLLWVYRASWCYAGLSYVVPMLLMRWIYKWDGLDRESCPTIIQCQDPCIVEADPDIAGIGVRIATYTQAICNVLILGFASDASRVGETYGTLVATSLATVITIGIFLWHGDLSLDHGIVADGLLEIAVLPTNLVESWRINSPGLFLVQQSRLFIYYVTSLYITIYMPCVGSEPKCNLCIRSSLIGLPTPVIAPLSRSIRLFLTAWIFMNTLRDHLWAHGLSSFFAAFPAMISQTRHEAWAKEVDRVNTSL